MRDDQLALIVTRNVSSRSRGHLLREPRRTLDMPKQTRKTPWEKPAPKKSRHTKLTPKSKAKAKGAARGAGRKYPSLVDNMNAAKKQRQDAKSKKK